MLLLIVGTAASNGHSFHQAAPRFPWKLSHTERLKVFFMCMEFRAAVQLTVGELSGRSALLGIAACCCCCCSPPWHCSTPWYIVVYIPWCAGQLIVLLFVLINKLNFPNGCLSSIFYVAAAVLVAQDAHVGSKMNAAAFVIGPLWFGSVLAGCMVRSCRMAALNHFVLCTDTGSSCLDALMLAGAACHCHTASEYGFKPYYHISLI